MTEGTFTDFSIKLSNLTKQSKVRIASAATTRCRFYLDEVRITPTKSSAATITLAGENQDDNNTPTLTAHLGETVDVVLHRTLVADGGWYTLCLPFDITASDVANTLKGAHIETLTSVVSPGTSTTLQFSEATAVSAGTPFILQPTADLNDVVFSEKRIDTDEPLTVMLSNDDGEYLFIGCFDPISLNDDGTERFLSSDGQRLTKPKGTSMLKALRAYFVVPSVGSEVNISTSQSTQIALPTAQKDADDERIYDLSGRQLRTIDGASVRGVYIRNGRKIAHHQ